jgi:hypothetical protein
MERTEKVMKREKRIGEIESIERQGYYRNQLRIATDVAQKTNIDNKPDTISRPHKCVL